MCTFLFIVYTIPATVYKDKILMTLSSFDCNADECAESPCPNVVPLSDATAAEDQMR